MILCPCSECKAARELIEKHEKSRAATNTAPISDAGAARTKADSRKLARNRLDIAIEALVELAIKVSIQEKILPIDADSFILSGLLIQQQELLINES